MVLPSKQARLTLESLQAEARQEVQWPEGVMGRTELIILVLAICVIQGQVRIFKSPKGLEYMADVQ